VARCTTSAVRGSARRSSRSTGSPTDITTRVRGRSRGFLEYGGSSSCAPHCPTGRTGDPVSSPIRAAPDLPVIGHICGSRVMVPSG